MNFRNVVDKIRLPKITLPVAIVLAAIVLSVGYYLVHVETDKRAIEEIDNHTFATLEARSALLRDCELKYETLVENDKKEDPTWIQTMWRLSEQSCAAGSWRRDSYFDIDNFYYCEHGVLEIHSHESWVKACMEYKEKLLQ
jgi:hypothetical protein